MYTWVDKKIQLYKIIKTKKSWKMETHNKVMVTFVEQRFQRIKELFEQKNPGNWILDETILERFNHTAASVEQKVETALSIETLDMAITEGEILQHERSVKLPLPQALDLVIELVENDSVPFDGCATLVFLSTKMMSGSPCLLCLWRYADGEFILRPIEVGHDARWLAGFRVLRRSKGESFYKIA